MTLVFLDKISCLCYWNKNFKRISIKYKKSVERFETYNFVTFYYSNIYLTRCY